MTENSVDETLLHCVLQLHCDSGIIYCYSVGELHSAKHSVAVKFILYNSVIFLRVISVTSVLDLGEVRSRPSPINARKLNPRSRTAT